MNTRIETKWLFDEGVSPHIKSLILKSRAGIILTEREKEELKSFNESVVSMVSPTSRHNRIVKPPKPIEEPQTFDELNKIELDLQELIDEFVLEMELQDVLEEMGYGK